MVFLRRILRLGSIHRRAPQYYAHDATVDTLQYSADHYEQVTVVAAHLIDCVTRDETRSPYERILRVGGPNLPGVVPPDTSRLVAELRKRGLPVAEATRWTLSNAEAIEGILRGRWSFYMQLGVYDVVQIQVATSPTGRSYLKAEVDADTPDELLFLPQCR